MKINYKIVIIILFSIGFINNLNAQVKYSKWPLYNGAGTSENTKITAICGDDTGSASSPLHDGIDIFYSWGDGSVGTSVYPARDGQIKKIDRQTDQVVGEEPDDPYEAFVTIEVPLGDGDYEYDLYLHLFIDAGINETDYVQTSKISLVKLDILVISYFNFYNHFFIKRSFSF